MQAKCLQRIFRGYRIYMTYEQLQMSGLPGSASPQPRSRSYRQDSRVSLTALREKVGAIVTSVTSGERLQELSEKFARDGLSVKIRPVFSQEAISGISAGCSVTLPRWGIRSAGGYGALATSALRTSGNACSFWRTAENDGGGTDLSGDVSHAYGARRGADEATEQRACEPLDQKGRRDESCGTDRISGNVPYTVCERGVDEPSDVDATKGREQAFGHIVGLHSAIPHAAGDELGVYGSAGEVEEIGSVRGDHGKRTQGNDGGQWWEAEPDVGRVVDGISHRVDRLRCLGNAVVPQQAYPIFRAIAEYEEKENDER